ncbi:MAG: hypothetical protein AAB426_12220 [Myxococcota bacterium]
MGGRLTFAVVLACVGVTLVPMLARANRDEQSLTLRLGAVHAPLALEVGAAYTRGLSELVALELAGGLGHGTEGTYGVATGGVRIALDVLTWVPSLAGTVGGCVASGEGARALSEVRAGVRRYLSFDWSVGMDVGVRFVRRASPQLIAHAELGRHF